MDERQGLIAQASTLKAIYESDYSHIESKYTAPWYLAHRVDLHSSLKELALQDAGVGRPARLRLRARVVSIVSACQGAVSIGTRLNLILLFALGSQRRKCCSRRLYNPQGRSCHCRRWRPFHCCSSSHWSRDSSLANWLFCLSISHSD